MTVGMLGRKVGMMRLYDGNGRVRPVTAVELGPNLVTQIRSTDRDGYSAIQVGFTGDRKRMTRPERGHLQQAGIDQTLTMLREVETDGTEFTLGQEIRVDAFTPGEFVDVTATSKGRGFSGGMRRWNFRGAPATHGGKKPRGPGSVGAGTYPGKTWKGQKMAGHMGARRKTVRNLLVVLIDPTRNLLMIQGSVPGPNGALVEVNMASRPALADFDPPAAFAPPDDSASLVATDDAEAEATDDEATDAVVDGEATADEAADEAPVEEAAAAEDEAPADDSTDEAAEETDAPANDDADADSDEADDDATDDAADEEEKSE